MERKQLSVFALIFLAVIAALAAGYFLLLRPGYGILYQDVREADAAEIVAELDKQGIDYRLEDDGHRILVPEGDLGRARVLIAGSGVAMGGVVGFELFNETDMGLTDFAQKVNYQRALQGELARTIMAMDGIEFARVHLSLPERALFRASQQVPKAAVTIQTEGGRTLDPARVNGIQQLVSSAVVDLPAVKVAVLDNLGRLLSAPAGDAEQSGGGLSEKAALEEYYRARARGVAERLLPGLPFEIRVLAIPVGGTIAESSSDQPDSSAPAEPQRNFQLRIAFRTEAPLGSEDQELLRSAIVEAAGLSVANGDSLRFETGALGQRISGGDLQAVGSAYAAAPPPSVQPSPPILRSWLTGTSLANRWVWMAVAFIAICLLILVRRRSRLSSQEQQSFADMLSESIALRREFPDDR